MPELGVVQHELDRIAHIVQRLLDFHRPKHGLSSQQRIDQLLTDVLALTGKQLEQSGIQLRYNASNQLLPIIAVGDQIKQVFLNLILNAIEAMPDGGMLTIDTQQQTSTLSITLADTGIGIPPDIMPHLFEPFFSTKHTGSGLGLAVSHEIITNHGGTLTAVNPTTHTVTNPGAAFLITLPSISPNEG